MVSILEKAECSLQKTTILFIRVALVVHLDFRQTLLRENHNQVADQISVANMVTDSSMTAWSEVMIVACLHREEVDLIEGDQGPFNRATTDRIEMVGIQACLRRRKAIGMCRSGHEGTGGMSSRIMR